MRFLIVALALQSALLVAAGGFLWREGERARHLAVPMLSDPSPMPSEPVGLSDLPACQARLRARAPGRVTALLQASDGALWIGTFDAGVLRAAPGALPAEVGGAEGRALFTNDLTEHQGMIWVATQSGVLVLTPSGEHRPAILANTAVTSFARVGDQLYGGTSRGLLRLSLEAGAVPVMVRGPFGDPVRVNALTVNGAVLWLGSVDGAYSLSVAELERPGPLLARWHPLVFGTPPAQSNVVTALVPFGDGVLAGTDNGGLVRLSTTGVMALRFIDPRASEVNPGAAAAVGSAAVFGSQGGGLLVASNSAEGLLRVGRPRHWPAAQVSALRATDSGLLAASADGAILVVDCAAGLLAQAP